MDVVFATVGAQWHRMNVPHAAIERMDLMKQSLFRGVSVQRP